MYITFQGTEYECATTLRVAYVIQDRFGHKPYMSIFKGLREMALEQQIRLLYIAFSIKNPDVCSEKQFLDELLDNWGMTQVAEKLNELVEGITYNGLSPEKVAELKAAAENPQMPPQEN